MIRNWPTGSARRDRGALESGTKSAVSDTAARPTGMFAQKMPRQPTVPTSTPPSTGPSGSHQHAAEHGAERHGQPEHAVPYPDSAGAFGPSGERVGDDAERRRVEHRSADTLQDPEADQPAQAGRQAAQPRAEGEQRQADLEDRPAPDPVGDRAGEHQQRGQHDRVVQAHHEQAHAADREHEGAAPPAGHSLAGVGAVKGDGEVGGALMLARGKLESEDGHGQPFL